MIWQPSGAIVKPKTNNHFIKLATGETANSPVALPTVPGRNVISFWPAPSQPVVKAGAQTTVEVTTIESITNYVTMHAMGNMTLSFGSPNWHAFS